MIHCPKTKCESNDNGICFTKGRRAVGFSCNDIIGTTNEPCEWFWCTRKNCLHHLSLKNDNEICLLDDVSIVFEENGLKDCQNFEEKI